MQSHQTALTESQCMQTPASLFTPDPASRLAGIDALRGLAVLLMIEQHLGLWLWDRYYELFRHPLMLCLNGLGGLAAPVFITLAGLGCSLLPYRHAQPDRALVGRGLLLMLFGYGLNLLTPSWFAPGSWYVLHMIGLTLVLAPLLRRLPTPALVLLWAVVLCATVIIQHLLQTPLHLSNARMASTALPGGAMRLALAEGHFPVFPWLAYGIAGILAGRWLLGSRRQCLVRMAGAALGAGLVLAACNLVGFAFARHGILLRACTLLPRFYPSLLPITLLLLALSMLAVAGSTALESRLRFTPRNPLVCLGRCSLTLLIAHIVIFREISHHMHFWHTFSLGQTLLITGLTLFLAALLSVIWRSGQFRFGAEWLLRKGGG